MRRLLAGLVLAAAALIAPVSLALPSLAGQVPHTCAGYVHDQVALGNSRTWLSGWSGCKSGYPVQYNRTACIYRNVVGTFWYDGPTRQGNGSSTSNYSGVTCTQFPYPQVVQVWIWVNIGNGWTGRRLF